MVGFKEWILETEIRGRRVERKFTSLRGAEETKEAWEKWGHTVKMTERDGTKDVIGVLFRGPAWRTGGRRAESKGTTLKELGAALFVFTWFLWGAAVIHYRSQLREQAAEIQAAGRSYMDLYSEYDHLRNTCLYRPDAEKVNYKKSTEGSEERIEGK